MEKTIKRTFTEVGKTSYTQDEIEKAICQIEWENFRRENLLFVKDFV